MSDVPTPPPLPPPYPLPPGSGQWPPYAPPYPPPPAPGDGGPHDSRWGTVLAWVVIAGCVGLIFLLTTVSNRQERAGGAPPMSGVELKINARMAVGFRAAGAWTGSSGARGMDGGVRPEQFEAAIDSPATPPADRLRALVAVGELKGGAAALERLDRVAPEASSPELEQDLAALRTIYGQGADAVGGERASALVERHGWFGRLALAYGRPADHPDRRAAVRPALRAMLSGVAFVLLGALAFLAGLVLLVLGLVYLAGGRLRRAYQPPAQGSGVFLEAFAVYLVGHIGVSLLIGLVFIGRDPPVWAHFLLAGAVAAAVGWLFLRGASGASVRRGLGWHAGRGWVRELGAGFVAYLAGLPVMAAGVLVSSLLQHLSGVQPTHPAQEMLDGSAARAVQLYLLAAVMAPVLEETMFRGAFHHHLRRRLPWWAAGLVNATVFALIHPQGWVGAPMLAALGFNFAAAREWRGSLAAPTVAHACNNFVTVTLLVLLVS